MNDWVVDNLRQKARLQVIASERIETGENSVERKTETFPDT